ncbi:ribosome small subunit-dependent GTPase A [Salisediminibacterium selenitireducens]|uniref:Small ribosomal subunit biogenesis GTPase RsgA n=1 Tax=Bacillus selenitireducens (strain ATCC 700615 / DSM 15326 / MLS10) TaxID=439292 RepID=D6XTR8_BACIE|nr:ribosome small subunit-dependent GTPase A [Salisediminibacterium selenitireducens]ADH99204.1 ribosome small subunit-dependent GTPase A [[Bacillus] selenitireducens MLS10]
MPKGRIIKALSGFYYVESDEGIVQCRARGNFRNRKITPYVGDWVEYEAENHTDGYILAIDERENQLVRPPVANVEQAVLIFSVEDPKFSPVLLDRFLVHVEANGIEPLICMSKTDLNHDGIREELEYFEDAYTRIGYRVLRTSIYLEETIEQLKPYLTDRVSVFAGQSGVGKSSLLNILKPGVEIKTDETSKSLGRGKHTTRHVELIPLNEGGYVADTPGFSSLDFTGIEAIHLGDCFPEFQELSHDCKFRGCQHINEPKCRVKAAVDEGQVTKERYEHYVEFHEEIEQMKRRY